MWITVCIWLCSKMFQGCHSDNWLEHENEALKAQGLSQSNHLLVIKTMKRNDHIDIAFGQYIKKKKSHRIHAKSVTYTRATLVATVENK